MGQGVVLVHKDLVVLDVAPAQGAHLAGAHGGLEHPLRVQRPIDAVVSPKRTEDDWHLRAANHDNVLVRLGRLGHAVTRERTALDEPDILI
ncbi:MAG: hypothetical protein ACK56F_30490, partial [bacterium]